MKADWPRLQGLSLTYIKVNTIGSWGCARWQSLSELRLIDIGLNDEGAAAVAKGDWPVLSLLDLSDNIIGSAGACALAKGRWPML